MKKYSLLSSRKKSHWLRDYDFGLSLLTTILLIVVLSVYMYKMGEESLLQLSMLGEYRHIAIALLDGQGYASPFQEPSGPTAWMPPFFTGLLVLIFWPLGSDTVAAVWALMLIKALGMGLIMFTLLRTLRRTPWGRYRYIGAGGFFLTLFAGAAGYLGGVCADGWLIHLSIIALLYAITPADLNQWHRYILGILALLSPLISPNLALVFVVLVAARTLTDSWSAWRARVSEGFTFRQWLKRPLTQTAFRCALLFSLSLGAWSTRNYLVLDRVIPIKSNLWYEYYQANVLSDGIVNVEVFYRHHPYLNLQSRAWYIAQGEVAFLDSSKQMAQAFLRDYPQLNLERLRNRISFAFVIAHTTGLAPKISSNEITSPELAQLEAAGLAWDGRWVSVSQHRDQFYALFNSLELPHAQTLAAEWEHHKRIGEEKENSFFYQLIRRTQAMAPWIAGLIGLCIPALRRSRLFRYTLTSYLLFLLPYVLVSIYQRYLLFLLPQQIILIWMVGSYFLHQALSFLQRRPLSAAVPISAADHQPSL